jgi:hypothetical protein
MVISPAVIAAWGYGPMPPRACKNFAARGADPTRASPMGQRARRPGDAPGLGAVAERPAVRPPSLLLLLITSPFVARLLPVLT